MPVTHPLVGLPLNKQPTIFRWRKRHGNILAVKAIVEKPTFFKMCFFVKYFRQRLLSLVNMGLDILVSSLCDPPFEKSWLRPWTSSGAQKKRSAPFRPLCSACSCFLCGCNKLGRVHTRDFFLFARCITSFPLPIYMKVS